MFELKEFDENAGLDVYEMFNEIGPGENGYVNGGYNLSFEEFQNYIKRQIEISKGVNLKPEHVPQTLFGLYINGRPVGFGKLRHYLNDELKKIGGHIGYSIRPSERGKGYGNIILRELLIKAKEIGIDRALLTCLEGNIMSRKVIEANGGKLDNITNGECYYWIDLKI